jgi:hypothetical protein
MKVVNYTETLVSIHQSTQRLITGDSNFVCGKITEIWSWGEDLL